jgi:hypothetical protein
MEEANDILFCAHKHKTITMLYLNEDTTTSSALRTTILGTLVVREECFVNLKPVYKK